MSEIEAELKEVDRSMVSLLCDHRVAVPGCCPWGGVVGVCLCTGLKLEGTRQAVGVVCKHAGALGQVVTAATA